MMIAFSLNRSNKQHTKSGVFRSVLYHLVSSTILVSVVWAVLFNPSHAFLSIHHTESSPFRRFSPCAHILIQRAGSIIHLAAPERIKSSSSTPSNPIQSLMSGLASSILPGGGGGSYGGLSKEVESQLLSTVADFTWGKIESDLKSKSTPEEIQFRSNLPYGYGSASPLHNLRLYDSSNEEKDVRVTFFRDSASWCPYCQKVWIALEEKRIPYRVERINMSCYGSKPRHFLQMQPNGQIPVAIIDGEIYNQSNDILFALDAKFPNCEVSLSPKDKKEKERAEYLYQLERKLFSVWLYWLTGPSSPDSAGRFRSEFMSVLSVVEEELQKAGGKGFFLGDRMTYVDIQFSSFLERMCASLLFYKGFQLRFPSHVTNSYPYINKWLDAMETRESYQVTKSDYYTHNWDLPPQLGGCTAEPEGERYRKAINGERRLDGNGGSWDLPLHKDNDGIEPDWTFCYSSCKSNEEYDNAAKREAVERLSSNHDNVTRFASRAAGKSGFPPVMAPLADPKAVPNERIISTVDAVLRCVSMALIHGTSFVQGEMEKLAEIIAKEDTTLKGNVVDSIAYLRDRVGVPRDMRLPAARQFRAHLNWSLGILLDA